MAWYGDGRCRLAVLRPEGLLRAVVFGYGLEVVILREQLAYSEFFLLALVGAAGMCLWQAENREQQHVELQRQRDVLARVSRADPLTDALVGRGASSRSFVSPRPFMMSARCPSRTGS